MMQHEFVREDLLSWEEVTPADARPNDPPQEITLSGDIICEQGVIVHVRKVLETRLGRRGEVQVRGRHYAYNAYRPEVGPILRYDNSHSRDDEQFDRHEYDERGHFKAFRIIPRAELPTLAEFLTEVAAKVST
jgi:hypothetical protein